MPYRWQRVKSSSPMRLYFLLHLLIPVGLPMTIIPAALESNQQSQFHKSASGLIDQNLDSGKYQNFEQRVAKQKGFSILFATPWHLSAFENNLPASKDSN